MFFNDNIPRHLLFTHQNKQRSHKNKLKITKWLSATQKPIHLMICEVSKPYLTTRQIK